MYTVKNASVCTEKKQTLIKMIVHVADAVENLYQSTMIRNLALFSFAPFSLLSWSLTKAQPYLCLVPRRLSFDEDVRAKEGKKETTGETELFPWSLPVHHQSLPITWREKEAPGEEAGLIYT